MEAFKLVGVRPAQLMEYIKTYNKERAKPFKWPRDYTGMPGSKTSPVFLFFLSGSFKLHRDQPGY